MGEMWRHAQVARGDDGAARRVLIGINVESQIVFEQTAKRFQNPAFKVGVVFFLKNFAQAGNAHRDADHFLGVTREVGGQPEITRVIGNEHRFAEGPEQIDAVQEIPVIDHAAVAGEVSQGHFHEHDDFLALRLRFLHELRLGAIEHVDSDFGDGPKAAALDEDRFFVKNFGGLDHLAVGGEHGRIREAQCDQLQAHQTIVHLLKRGPGELDHVHFDPVAREVVHQTGNNGFRLGVVAAGGVDQVDANDAQSLLFLDVFLVQHPHVNDDFRRLGFRRGLKPYAHPAVRFVLPRIAPGGHGVREHEKFRHVTALGPQPLQQQRVFVLQHRLQALPAHVAFARAVDGVADSHIIGGNRLGNGARGAADAEKPARDLLSGADFSEGSVLARVQVDLKRLMVGAGNLAFHNGRIIHEVWDQTRLKRGGCEWSPCRGASRYCPRTADGPRPQHVGPLRRTAESQ